MAMRTRRRKRINNLEAVNMQIESDARTTLEQALRDAGLFRYFSHTDIVKPAARWVRFGKPGLIPPRIRTLKADVKRLDRLLKQSQEKISIPEQFNHFNAIRQAEIERDWERLAEPSAVSAFARKARCQMKRKLTAIETALKEKEKVAYDFSSRLYYRVLVKTDSYYLVKTEAF